MLPLAEVELQVSRSRGPGGQHAQKSETRVVAVFDVEASNAFMAGPAFAANPVGEPFDPEQLVAAMHVGEPLLELILRSDQDATTDGLALELA